jgi:hypothetical protein
MDAIDPLLLVTQPVGELFNELMRSGADSGQLEEAVYNTQLPLTGGDDSGLQQFVIEGFPLIAQRIIFRCYDMGRRQS